MTRVYYALKPIIPWTIRVGIRRLISNRLRRRFSESWPILHSSARLPEKWPGWPNGKQFAFVITHDVEGTRGLARCRDLMDLEKAVGIRSSFNFVPEGEYRVPDALRAALEQENFEVGVHDLYHDGSLYRSGKDFHDQAPKINQYLLKWKASGFRAGFMFHNLEWLHELNVLYDASTFDTDPFEPQPHGVGTIFPFWVQRGGSQGYVEMPYTLPQDSTIFLIFKETTIDLWKKKIDWVASHGGMVLVNVHPDYIAFEGKPSTSQYKADLYEQLLKYVLSCYGDSCWYALPREVAAFAAQIKPQLLHNHNASASSGQLNEEGCGAMGSESSPKAIIDHSSIPSLRQRRLRS